MAGRAPALEAGRAVADRAAEAAPAVPLPDTPEPYIKVQVTGHLRDDLSASYGAEVRDTPAGTQLGTQLIVPLERG